MGALCRLLFNRGNIWHERFVRLRQWFAVIRKPCLVAPEKSELAAHDQVFSIAPNFTRIYFTFFWIEDFAAVEVFAVLRHVPDDVESEDLR